MYRPHCVWSVLTTSVKILPYRPPARLIRANYFVFKYGKFFAIFQNLFFRVSTQIMSFEVVVYMKKSKGVLVFWPFKIIPKISPCLLFWVINPFAKFSNWPYLQLAGLPELCCSCWFFFSANFCFFFFFFWQSMRQKSQIIGNYCTMFQFIELANLLWFYC